MLAEPVETVSAASVEPIYACFEIRSTPFCSFISIIRKDRRNPPFRGSLSSFNLGFIGLESCAR